MFNLGNVVWEIITDNDEKKQRVNTERRTATFEAVERLRCFAALSLIPSERQRDAPKNEVWGTLRKYAVPDEAAHCEGRFRIDDVLSVNLFRALLTLLCDKSPYPVRASGSGTVRADRLIKVTRFK